MNHAGTLVNNIQAIAKIFGSSYEIAVLIVSPSQILCEGTLRPETENIPIEGSTEEEVHISLENVKFCYPSKPDVAILKGVSIDVKKNQIVALVGQSGCGKSSIVSLIERFYDPEEGKVLFSK